MERFTIDDLAHRTGVSSRNIRTYQAHGLLPPPTVEGRVGFYDDTHLERLELIRRLQSRGFSRIAIRDLLRAWEGGGTVADVLGLEHALTGTDDLDTPLRMTVEDVVAVYGDDPAQRERALALGLLIVDDEGAWIAPSRQLFELGAVLLAHGIPLSVVLDQAESMLGHADALVSDFEQFFRDHLLPKGSGEGLGPAEFEALIEAVGELQPIRTISRAVELRLLHAVEQFLTEATTES